MKYIQINSRLIIISAIVGLVIAFSLAFSIPLEAKAQSTVDDASTPINLSQSGGANKPKLVIDSEGVIHVLWKDTFEGIVSTRNDLEGWNDPLTGTYPFETAIPKLLSDSEGNIHAFWTNERSQLTYSNITAQNFGVLNNWSRPLVLGEYVGNFAVSIDPQGFIHLAYIRVFEDDTNPAGIYYRNSINNGSAWTSSILLYQSRYLRSITEDFSNINISSTNGPSDETTAIYIVWDNLALRQVYSIHSLDSGITWGSYLEVDGPANTSGLSAPFNIDVSAQDEDIVLVWQVGQEGVSCSLHSKYSNNRGDTWSENQRILKQLSAGGCPEENRIIGVTETYSLMMTRNREQVFLTAWNGTSWSDPQLENMLGSFTNPISLANVDLRCHDITIRDNHLNIVGCDDGAGDDIWFIKLSAMEIDDWFPPPSAWSNPTAISESENNFQALQVVAGQDGRMHSLWMEPDGIYYAQWDGNDWTKPTAIINAIFSESDELAAAISQDYILTIVWTSSQTGELLSSWANSSSATDKNEWSKPQLIPSPQLGSSSPDMHIDPSGEIFLVYSTPINENWGVYYSQSNDRGISWTEPSIMFDAVNSGWEMVNQTRLSMVDGESLISTWVQSSVKRGPLALFFSNSRKGDEQQTPTMISNNPIIWNDIIGFGPDIIHRVWQENEGDQLKIVHSLSSDKGETWNAFPIFSIGEAQGLPSVTIDQVGQLYLTYTTHQENDFFGLQHWIWDNNGWHAAENLDLSDFYQQDALAISSAISSQDELFTLLSLKISEQDSDEAEYQLVFTKRKIATPMITFDEKSTSTPMQEATSVTASPTPLPTTDIILPTPTITLVPTNIDQTQPQPASGSSLNSLTGLALGAGLVFLLVVIVFIFRWLINIRK